MAFETGFVANEFDLQEKLNAFILSTPGWKKVSQPEQFESVYFSSGEDGYKEIYIKTVAGLTEGPSAYCAGKQVDLGDGYVGYMNMFVYQFYPENGDGYDGYGEAGKFGPYFIFLAGESGEEVYLQHLSNQSASNRKWNYLSDMRDLSTNETYPSGFSANNPVNDQDAAFDGRRYIYWKSISDNGYFRYDIGEEANKIVDTFLEWNTGGNVSDLLYTVDRKTRKEYLWDATQNFTTINSPDTKLDPYSIITHLTRYDLSRGDAGLIEMGFDGPPWSDLDPGAGVDYAAKEGKMIYDGHSNIYRTRGQASSGFSEEWAKYNIETNVWNLLNNVAPIPGSNYDYISMSWLDKHTSGFSHHRIYLQSGTTIYYVNIDENNGLPLADWISVGSLPVSPGSEGTRIFHNHLNRWYWFRGASFRSLYYAEMTSGTLTWNLIDSNYAPVAPSQESQWIYCDGYASRVRVSIEANTQYWFFNSRDHILVATKSDDQYSYCYAGAIDPFTSTSPQALSKTNIYPGINVEIPINHLKGEFIVGAPMSIVNIAEGAGGEIIGDVENVSRKFMPMEQFTIIGVSPGESLIADEINNHYVAGARIGYDPQPVGITLEGLDKIQMLNSINNVNETGSYDMAENIAYLTTVSDTVINGTGNDDRHNTFFLWPILVVKSGNTAAYSGEEVRGALRSIFAVSSQAGLSIGDNIVVGDNTYIVLDTPTSKPYVFVFGPVGGE